MVVRARENISQGTEITQLYDFVGDSYVERDKFAAEVFQAPCDCVMCASDRNDGQALCEEREVLMKAIRSGGGCGDDRGGCRGSG